MLRLAECKGLLMGRRLSQVQDFATQLLQRQNNIARNKEQDRQFRLALLASGHVSVEDAFPEETVEVVQAAADMAEDVFDREGVDYDYSQVKFESPEGMDPKDIAELEEFLRDPHVIVPTPQIQDGGWS